MFQFHNMMGLYILPTYANKKRVKAHACFLQPFLKLFIKSHLCSLIVHSSLNLAGVFLSLSAMQKMMNH